MSDVSQPVVKTYMLIRVPIERAFDAFVNPYVTTRFWFTHSSGPLEPGRDVVWEWRMYGCSTRVHVLEVTPNNRIKIEWGEANARSMVEWSFEERSDDRTLVTIRNFGFTGDDVVGEAIDSMGGFSLVLANAKALLEHNLELNLIFDRYPDGHVETTEHTS